MCEDVDSGENRGWPLPSKGKGRRKGGLSANVPEQGMTASAVVAVCQKWLSLQHSKRGEYFHANPPGRFLVAVFLICLPFHISFL